MLEKRSGFRKVLLITADQWRGDALGFLGHPACRTPNLDALAADGAAFQKHYTCAVPCGPARTTLLTGLYPFIHRSVRNGTPLDRRHSNIALEARKAGRDPVLFGYTDSSVDPRDFAAGDPRLKTYEGVLSGFRLEASLNESCLSGWLTELAGKGYEIDQPLSAIYRHRNNEPVLPRFSRGPARYAPEDSDTAYIADKVLDYLRLRRSEDWFIHAVFLRPHPPIIAPEPYNTLIDSADVPKPKRLPTLEAEAASHPFLAEWLKDMANPAYFESQVDLHAIPESDREDLRAVYFGLIAEVDAQIGRIIAHLKKTGEYDETLIIFTSDHGEMLGDHWCWGKGGWFDAANHIPLIIRDPSAPQAARGQRHDVFTESVDLVPTMLDFMGLPLPVECSGHSLGPFIAGHAPTQWRRQAFWEYDFRDVATQRYEAALGITSDECTLSVILDEDYKFVHFTSLPPMLYDRRADPHEMRNLADEPAMAPVIAGYARRLLTLKMLHAERGMTTKALTPDGVVESTAPRGMPAALYGPVG